MLRSIKQLYGNKLGASDGEIGQVKDFYFDDHDWAIRYLVVDTGSWLPGRKVLISPHSLGMLDQPEKILRVKLTRNQIEQSPSIETRQPVARPYEEEYYRYYGWPFYWQGYGLWGVSAFPSLQPLAAGGPETATNPRTRGADARLWSTQSVNGYQLRTGDEMIGHICDFMMDAQSWAIGQLVVKTGHRLSGKEVLIEMKNVSRINREESTVFADLPAEAVAKSPAYHLVSDRAVD
jgi:hypothetical protein